MLALLNSGRRGFWAVISLNYGTPRRNMLNLELVSVKLNLFDYELVLVRLKSDVPYKTVSRVLWCSSRFLPPRRISSRWLRHLGISPNMRAVNGFVKGVLRLLCSKDQSFWPQVSPWGAEGGDFSRFGVR